MSYIQGEKASAEREIKRLHGQKAILERDITKRESIAGRRRDSVMDRSSNIFDPRKAKGFGVTVDQVMKSWFHIRFFNHGSSIKPFSCKQFLGQIYHITFEVYLWGQLLQIIWHLPTKIA